MNAPEGFRVPRSADEMEALLNAIPYARLLGLSSAREGEDVILRMPYRDDLVGNALNAGASAVAVRTSSPSRSAVDSSALSIPGEMSVAVAEEIAPLCSRLSEK